MSDFLKEFKFEKKTLKITYFDEEPLQLTNEFIFFHNKSKFRKELTQLQYLFKSYTKTTLHAAGIRDSYIEKAYTDEYLIILFTTNDIVKKTNQIIKNLYNLEISSGCFYLETTSNYMLLLTKDMDGLILGIGTMEEILKQIMENYLNQKKFDEYLKVRPFQLISCT
ncbi:MAG: hypothetical protein ACFFBV_03085 [Promethearchaeota archaeon]